MYNSKRLRPLTFCLAIFFISGLLDSAAMGQAQTQVDTGEDDQRSTQNQAWDQSSITKLANELERTLGEAYERSLDAPRQPTALQQRERDAAQSIIRRARDLSQEYARRMRDGWDRESSEAYFRAVAGEVAHVWDTAGDAKLAKSSQPLIERLQRILDELRAAYDAP